ncbi:MAG: hypothetical protein Q8942_03555 [Bacillota bacterium]|nr:hypothetical protein [Bacillota bacterium]
MKINTILLAKVLLKGGGNKSGKGKNRPRWLLWIILAVAFLPLVAQLAVFTSVSYEVLKGMALQSIIPAIALALTSFVVFFFGIFYVLNTFYFTTDIESLLPLPFKPFEIIGAKFIVVTIYEYLTELVVLLPVLIVYGVMSGSGVLYYIYFLVIFLTLPVIPLVISSLIIMPLMRFTGLVKNKDRFKYIASIIALGIGVGFQVVIRKFVNSAADTSKLENTLTDLNRNVKTVTDFFPSAKFAALSLIKSAELSGFANIFLFICITAIFVFVFLFLSQLLYFKGVMGVSESGSRRRKLSRSEFEKITASRSVLLTYFLKEIKIIIRTPAYFINCLLSNFIWPVIILIPNITSNRKGMSISQFGELINQNANQGFILAIGFGFSLFLASSNCVTSTAISREGQNLYINKYIPLGFDKQILMKVMTGVVIGILGVGVLFTVISIMFKLSLTFVLVLIVSGIIGIIFSSFTGIIFDLLNPKLNWDNEQKAVKQNLNVIFNMLVSLIVAGVFIVLIFFTGLSLIQTFVTIVIAFGLFISILYFLVSRIGVKLFKRIEG